MAATSIRVLLVLCITSVVIRLSAAIISGQLLEAENSPIELGLYFRKEPDDTIVVNDAEAILHCSAHTTLPSGNLSFQWTRNNVKVTPTQRRQLLNNGSLIFSKIENLKTKYYEPDDGEYRCAITVDDESTKLTLVSKPAIVQTANLSATVPDGHAVNATSAVGGTARLKCEIHSIPPAKFKWTFQDKPLPPNDERYDTTVPGILYVSDTRPSDSGEYKCHATNSLLNSNYTIGFFLQVTDDARSSNATTTTVETLIVRRGREQLLLDCYSENQDVNTSVVWTYKRAPEDRIKTVSVARRGYSVLKLEQVGVWDNGTYVCQHVSGSRHHDPIRTVNVDVTTPPAISTSSDNKNTRLAFATRLVCQVSGAPAPNVSWWHNGNPVKTNSRVKATEKGLLIANTNTADAGMYQCFAANEYGTAWTAVRLRISDLSNPSAPSDMQCETLSSRSIRVRWKPPKDDSTQPPITFAGKKKTGEQQTIAYSVFYHYADGSQNGDWSIPSVDQTVVVSNLQPNRGYTFYVRTFGGKSGSNPSNEVTCVTLPLEMESASVEPASNSADDDLEQSFVIKPRSKSILSSKLINETTFEVSWQMDKPNGIIVDELFIECKKRGANDSITIPVNFEDKRAVLFNLDPQSEYDIWLMIVVNKTKAMAGMISYNGKTFVTPKDGFEIFATQISSHSVNVTWTIPSQTTTAATRLDIVYSDEKSNRWIELPINNKLRYKIIDDMRSDTSYTIMLRLNEWPDRGEAVASTRIQLSSSNPSSIVENVSVRQSGPNSVRISWEGGAAAAQAEYVVNVYPSQHTNVLVKSNSVELADLKTNVEYKILVSAAAKTNEERATAAAFRAKPTSFTLQSRFEGGTSRVNDSRSIFAEYLNDDQMLGVYIGLTIGCVFVVLSVIAVIYCKRLVKYKRRGVTNRSDVFAAAAVACERNEMKYFPRNSNGHKLYSVESSAIREESDKLLTTIDLRGEDANSTTIRDQKDNNENEGGDSGYCDRHHSHSPRIKENGGGGRSEHKARKCSDLTVDDGFSENEASHGASGTSSNDSTRFT